MPTILEVLVASLAADEGKPVETRLAIAEAVLTNPAANLPTRKRAAVLRDRFAAALHPEQIDAGQTLAQQKTVEEWATEFFRGRGAENYRFDDAGWGWSPEISPVSQNLRHTGKR